MRHDGRQVRLLSAHYPPHLICAAASAADWYNSSGMAIHPRGAEMASSFNHITVLGAGVLGAQISFQIAHRGFEVTTYDISDAALKQARHRLTVSPRYTQRR
jgi:2-polyprenyl-3-methyl-5-hydroxy-6-metoxy-1,4-benzoquinol methylase